MADQSLLQDFIEETGEHLEGAERNLLRLEQEPGNGQVLNEVFRAIHTIKGSAEYLGLVRISDLTHRLESFLDLLRRGERVLDSAGIDLLIGANDRLGRLADDLTRHRAERTAIDDLVARIDGFCGAEVPVTAEQGAGDTEGEVDSDPFGDEYDEELFGIFADQLKEGLSALVAESGSLADGPAPAEVLGRYADRLQTLRASANYMGYDKLRRVYDQWAGALTATEERLSAGRPVDWAAFEQEVTRHYMDRVRGMFAKVPALAALDVIPPAAAAPVTAADGSEGEASDLWALDDIGLELVPEDAQAVGEDDAAAGPELALFSDGALLAEDIAPTPEGSGGIGLDQTNSLDQSLLQDFIEETGEHLEGAERNLLRLEQEPGNGQVLNEVFRAIHTIKGSAEYLGLVRISDLTHRLESFLDLLRRGERVLDSAGIDLLIGANDRLGRLADDLTRHRAERTAIDDLVARIDGFCGAEVPVTAEQGAGDTEGEVDSDPFGDEYDEELFGIFADQLKEGLSALVAESGSLADGPAPAEVLGRYADRLQTLRASANYMGYDKLRRVYDQWAGALTATEERLSAGRPVDWAAFEQEVTRHYMDRVRGMFAKVPALAALDVIPPAAAAPVTAAPLDAGTADTVTEDTPVADGPFSAQSAAEAPQMPADGGLLNDFIEEATEHLESVEGNLLGLAHQPDPREGLNELFRAVHTIKGASEYLGMARIADLAHKLESLLDLLRRGERTIDATVGDLLMAGHDRMGVLVGDLMHHGQEQSPIEDLLAGIDSWLASTPEQEPPCAPPPVAAQREVRTEPLPEAPSAVSPPKQTAVYEEPYDAPLFAIFMAQLNEGLSAIAGASAQWVAGASAAPVIALSREWLVRLRAAANYMGYDDLMAIYDAWHEDLQNWEQGVSGAVSQSTLADWNRLTQARAAQVRAYFRASPETAASPEVLQASDTVVTQGDDAVQAVSMETPAPEPPPTVVAEEPPAAPAVVAVEDAGNEEQALLALLEDAFDAKFAFDGNKDVDSLADMDVAKELLSEVEGVLDPVPPVARSLAATPSRVGHAPADGIDLESLLFSDGAGNRIPRKPLTPMPLAEMLGAADMAAPSSVEGDRPTGGYMPGRRRSDRLHDRLTRQSIRVDAAKIDTLMNQVGELVVNRAGFNQLFMDLREMQLELKQSKRLNNAELKTIQSLTNRVNEATVALGRVTSELQENVMKVRMLPIAQLFSRYPRLVHDLVRNTDKKVSLEIQGEETELDRMVIEQIADPLVHLIRNAVDHGIEPVSERTRKGKPETGTLRLEAYYEGNYVVLEASDDGRGIDTEQIKARALTKGFVSSAELAEMSDDQIRALIMQPGFSTADAVTHTSGRGVGMDVVKDNIEKLNGTIEIISTPGHSTVFRIRIPLTLAIIQALLVRVAGSTFTIPLSAVDETLRIHQNEISTLEGMEIYYLRETTLPLIRVARVFKMAEAAVDARELFVVVVNVGSRQVGLVVDALRGRQEVVIKPLEDYLQERSGFSGATILGDGSISLILDVAEVINLAIAQHTRKTKAVAI